MPTNKKRMDRQTNRADNRIGRRYNDRTDRQTEQTIGSVDDITAVQTDKQSRQ